MDGLPYTVRNTQRHTITISVGAVLEALHPLQLRMLVNWLTHTAVVFPELWKMSKTCLDHFEKRLDLPAVLGFVGKRVELPSAFCHNGSEVDIIFNMVFQTSCQVLFVCEQNNGALPDSPAKQVL